jgi:aminopeptidase YwaD
VTRGPMSLPSFVHDVAWAFADWLNDQSYRFAAGLKSDYPMVAPEGGKEPLRAEYSAYTMGSDHDVYQDSSFGIPAIYLNDWPDRYIHTNFDTAANIDPTKLKRAAFIGAASGYFLATLTEGVSESLLLKRLWRGSFDRYSRALRTAENLADDESRIVKRSELDYTDALAYSLTSFLQFSSEATGFIAWSLTLYPAHEREEAMEPGPEATGIGLLKLKRKSTPKGPLAVFGYDYFAEHAKAAGVETPKLLSYEGLWGSGEEYAYEVLNFANGKRNAQEICDAVSAEYGPVPLELVAEYLSALEKMGVVEEVT